MMRDAKINSFIWDVYCDWFIEIAKPRLNSGDAEQADTARRVLVYVLDKALKLLHPFMPFIDVDKRQLLSLSANAYNALISCSTWLVLRNAAADASNLAASSLVRSSLTIFSIPLRLSLIHI